MLALAVHGALLAAVSKHDIAGIVAVIAGIALLGFAATRVAAKVAGAGLIAAVGAVAVLIGILMFARAI